MLSICIWGRFLACLAALIRIHFIGVISLDECKGSIKSLLQRVRKIEVFIHAVGNLTCETHALHCARHAEFRMLLSRECSLQKLWAFLSGNGSLWVLGCEAMISFLDCKRI